jgi:hypothetical protein
MSRGDLTILHALLGALVAVGLIATVIAPVLRGIQVPAEAVSAPGGLPRRDVSVTGGAGAAK